MTPAEGMQANRWPTGSRRTRLPIALVIVLMVVGAVWALVGNLAPAPSSQPLPALGSVDLAVLPSRILNQSAVVVLTATARDTSGRNQTANASWSWRVNRASILALAPTAQEFAEVGRGVGPGSVNVTAEAALGGSRQRASLSLTVQTVRLVLKVPSLAAIGEPVAVLLSAVDPINGTGVTDYEGTIHFSSTDPEAVLPEDFTFLPENRGRANGSVTFATYGIQTLHAEDLVATNVAAAASLRADSRPIASVTIEPNPVDRRIVTFSANVTDPDGDPLTPISWEFGDGSTATSASVKHTYAYTGPYEVNLSALDSWGLAPRTASWNITVAPEGWFSPEPSDVPVQRGHPFIGSLDYFDLFKADAPWQNASKQISVFKLYAAEQWAPDAQVKQIIDDLNRRGIALAAEFGALTVQECGWGQEGFVERQATLFAISRVIALGGRIRYIDMDEPFGMASLAGGPYACHWNATKVAEEVKKFITDVHALDPDIVVGDTEPIWRGIDLAEYEGWFAAFRAVNGYELPFFHLDMDFSMPNWPHAAKHLEDAARARGIVPGIIYTGNWDDTTDETWLAHARERMAIYETRAGGRPDQVIFQSWEDKPDYNLPETNATSFTHLIDYYYRDRTVVTFALGSPDAHGNRAASGTLLDAASVPIASAQLNLTAEPLDGPGVYGEYVLTGIVPDDAWFVLTETVPDPPSTGIVGLRVNTECECLGTADFVVYGIRYAEGGEAGSRVPDGDFSQGGAGWQVGGNGTASFVPSDRGGWMLAANVLPTQILGAESSPFPVTPGAHYTLTVSARIPPSAAYTGYFAVFFFASQEVRRDTISFAPAVVLLSTMTTNAGGGFQAVVPSLPPYTFYLQAVYAGDLWYWTARGGMTVVP